jgi:hypothetical protein
MGQFIVAGGATVMFTTSSRNPKFIRHATVILLGGVFLWLMPWGEAVAVSLSRPKNTAQVVALLKEYRDALRESVKAILEDINRGRSSADFRVCDASRRLMLVELELADKPAARIAAVQMHLDRLKKIHDIAKKLFDRENMAAKDYFPVKAEWIRAKIDFLRVKNGASKLTE